LSAFLNRHIQWGSGRKAPTSACPAYEDQFFLTFPDKRYRFTARFSFAFRILVVPTAQRVPLDARRGHRVGTTPWSAILPLLLGIITWHREP